METKNLNFHQEGVITFQGNKKRKIFFSIFFFLLILILGITGILATRIWDPLWNPFRPKPEQVIKKMILEMEKVKTSVQKGEFFVKGESKEEGQFELRINSETKEDRTDPQKPKSEVIFEGTLSLEKGGGLEVKLSFAGEIKVINESAYIKLKKLPELPFPLGKFDISQVKDRWIKIDEEGFLNLLKETKIWTPGMERQYQQEKEKQKELEKKLQEEFKKLLKEKPWFSVKEQFPDKKIDKTKVYHYLVNLDVSLFSEFFLKKIIEEMAVEKQTSPLGLDTPFFEQEELKELREFLKKIEPLEIEVWIGKKDYLLYRLKGEKTFEITPEKRISGGLNLEYSKFNQPLKIEVPAEYESLEKVFGPLFEEIFKGLQEVQFKAKGMKIQASMSRIKIIAELLSLDEDSYQNLCKNKLLNKDHPSYGEKIKMLQEEIKEAQEGILDLSCYSAKNSYCVVADFPFPNQGKLCIDSFLNLPKEIPQELTCLGKGTITQPYRCP